MGWVKLDRQIFDHWLWQEKPFSVGQAWVDLILLASYEDGVQYYRGELYERKRGEVCASLKWLGERWGWSIGKVSRFLNILQKDKMVTQKRNAHGTTLSIENYTLFQDRRNQNETQTENRRKTDGKQTETLKKEEEGNKKIKEGQSDEASEEDFVPMPEELKDKLLKGFM